MTASPVDAKGDPMKAAAELEGLLHSTIATTDDPMAIKNAVDESWVRYEPIGRPSQTALIRSLTLLLGGHILFRNVARRFGKSCWPSRTMVKQTDSGSSIS